MEPFWILKAAKRVTCTHTKGKDLAPCEQSWAELPGAGGCPSALVSMTPLFHQAGANSNLSSHLAQARPPELEGKKLQYLGVLTPHSQKQEGLGDPPGVLWVKYRIERALTPPRYAGEAPCLVRCSWLSPKVRRLLWECRDRSWKAKQKSLNQDYAVFMNKTNEKHKTTHGSDKQGIHDKGGHTVAVTFYFWPKEKKMGLKQVMPFIKIWMYIRKNGFLHLVCE